MVRDTASKIAKTKKCHSCKYAGDLQNPTWASCDYILRTGRSRGEEISEHCSKYRPDKGKEVIYEI